MDFLEREKHDTLKMYFYMYFTHVNFGLLDFQLQVRVACNICMTIRKYLPFRKRYNNAKQLRRFYYFSRQKSLTSRQLKLLCLPCEL